MTKTNEKYDTLYFGTDLQGIEHIKAKGFPGTLLNEHAGPCYAVFLTDKINIAKKWGGVLIEVCLNGVETHSFYNGDYWHFYVLANELNDKSSWKIIETGEKDDEWWT